MVRLVTHNLLACHAKNCNANNFPLQFKDVSLEIRESEFNSEFLKNFMPKLEWKALVDTARQVSKYCTEPVYPNITFPLKLGDTSLPLEQPEMVDDEFLKNLHHVLFEVCYIPTCNQRKFSLPYHLKLIRKDSC